MTATWDFYKSFGVYAATSWFRAWNFLIDTVLPYYLVVIVVSMLVQDTLIRSVIIGTFTLVFIPFQFLYFLLCEALFGGKTLGKLITRTRVVKADGSKAGFVDILIRTVVRMFIVFTFLSFILNKNTSCPVALHDWLSGTRVVDDPKVIR